ncbi:MAG: class I SAM-dependent methyltransferase [Oligoflexia bacterium]|nr:class I SAM-dependent methyltransferase [Oligoflexia bacterium]
MGPNAEEIVNKLAPRIESFFHRHHQDPAVRSTFGYFSSHPVAPLNRKRLLSILQVLQSRGSLLPPVHGAPPEGRPMRVLDLACGGGVITCAIAALGFRAVGVDFSAEELRMARLFAFEETLDGVFLQADLLTETPWESSWEKNVEQTLGGKPDAVVLAYALHHFADPGKLLKRLSAWVQPGTLLVINEENPRSPLFRLKHKVRGLIQHDTETEFHQSHDEWRRLLEAHGFKAAQTPTGLDLLPGLGRLRPEKCWSLVFTAQRG